MQIQNSRKEYKTWYEVLDMEIMRDHVHMLLDVNPKIPVHYDTTKSKVSISILDNLTARITYCIKLISDLIDESTKLDRTLNKLVKNSDIVQKTGLSSGFIQQCIDNVLWSWRSCVDLHNDWENKLKRAQGRIESARDDKKKEKADPVAVWIYNSSLEAPQIQLGEDVTDHGIQQS